MFSPVHWLIVGIVALLVLGPDKLPGAARQAARAYRALSEARQTLTGHVEGLLGSDESANGADEPPERIPEAHDADARAARVWTPPPRS
jgi:TatA/E family protein of Tat protein translocase